MLRDGIGMGCYFLTYEALVQRHLKSTGGGRGDISPLWAVGYGAAAGYGLWFRYVLGLGRKAARIPPLLFDHTSLGSDEL
jgi:solute carrier family 25 carnitine/acylcarnitine transporter 20/29